MTNQCGPVFVAGCPRSGTSALSWALANHPGLWTSAETHFFYYLLSPALGCVDQSFRQASAEGSWLDKHGVSSTEFLQHIGVGLDALVASRSGGLRWIDGSPENILVGEQLLQMFPDAHIIHVVRDPRLVCLSMLSSGFPPPWARDLDQAVKTWCDYVVAGARLADAHPDRVLEVRQEQMLSDPASVAAALGARLGLTMPDHVSQFLARRRVNSSFDPASQADSSARSEDARPLDRTAFLDRHGAAVLAQTAIVAGRYGYIDPTSPPATPVTVHGSEACSMTDTDDGLIAKVKELGPWFHQIELTNGLKTRDIAASSGPQPLDHPLSRWRILQQVLPADLSGVRILDIGCADGFFAIELARRGATVLAVDASKAMIQRLDWLIEHLSIKTITTRVASLESFAGSKERFDSVLMIALLYHLRNPQLGLDIVAGMTDMIYLESALHEQNDDAYLYLQPPVEGVHSVPKWMPTEKCIHAMLAFAGLGQVTTLERPVRNRGLYVARR